MNHLTKLLLIGALLTATTPTKPVFGSLGTTLYSYTIGVAVTAVSNVYTASCTKAREAYFSLAEKFVARIVNITGLEARQKGLEVQKNMKLQEEIARQDEQKQKEAQEKAQKDALKKQEAREETARNLEVNPLELTQTMQRYEKNKAKIATIKAQELAENKHIDTQNQPYKPNLKLLMPTSFSLQEIHPKHNIPLCAVITNFTTQQNTGLDADQNNGEIDPR